MMVLLVNHSTETALASEVLVDISNAITWQLLNHVCPTWNVAKTTLTLMENVPELLGKLPQIALFDHADQAGDLGYHEVSPSGAPYGKVFVHDVLDNGARICEGPDALSTVISHEVVELAIDPPATLWQMDSGGILHAQEGCDGCQAFGYEAGTSGIWVSDFLFPAWFSNLNGGSGFDQMGKLDRALQVPAGCYELQFKDGQVKSIGMEQLPVWKQKHKAHPAARTYRRGLRA